MIESDFNLVKASASAAALAFSAVLQMLFPYKKLPCAIAANWKINLPFGVLSAGLARLMVGSGAFLASAWTTAHDFGVLNWLNVPSYLQIAFSLMLLDFTAYAWHRANHMAPFLWRFHTTHHSDRLIDASTAIRFHPVEILISLGIRVTVIAIFGVPVAGLLLFEVIYAFFNFIEHGNTRLPIGLENTLGKVFISPAAHRKHHSLIREELDSNFGTIFSFWDRLFVTHRHASSQEEIAVGLPGHDDEGIGRLFIGPFKRQ